MKKTVTIFYMSCLAVSASAAVITWAPATDTMDKSQLLGGSAVFAMDGCSSASGSTTVDGTTFTESNYTTIDFSAAKAPGVSGGSDISDGAPSTGDAGFDHLLKSVTASQSGITSGTQTIGGLVKGEKYQIQLFYNDQRALAATRSMTFGDGEASESTVTLKAGGTGWGQFAVGTFTADGPSQRLTHKANNMGNLHVNAILVTGTVAPLVYEKGKDFSLDQTAGEWRIDSSEEWQQSCHESENLALEDDMATPVQETATYRSVMCTSTVKRSPKEIVFQQSPVWQNWEEAGKIFPSNLLDAPVLLVKGPSDYWAFGRYDGRQKANFKSEAAHLEGFNMPLRTTPFPNQYDAPGGLKPGLGGYHAWQSRDMKHWVHFGPVTDHRSRWVTTAEYVDGKTYIYYDFPNDQDPHLYIDDDLTDGKPGEDVGMAFKDPSDGSDCGIIRDLDGRFHVIYEDWSPIYAARHAWDSPLAGHAVSPDGTGDFKILPPAVDDRTTPTGVFKEYKHPHWALEDPDHFPTSIARYEVHEPAQNAYGDWAAISIGGRYYLFGDYHPAGRTEHGMSVGMFTSDSIDKPFRFIGHVGVGHPDPDIGFAEGQFYLINQTQHDYTSPGPWVETVEVRVGVDTTNDGVADTWSDWQAVKEHYDYIKGFSKQIKRIPAAMDLSKLPMGYGFCFELRLTDTTANPSKPILDSITLTFD